MYLQVLTEEIDKIKHHQDNKEDTVPQTKRTIHPENVLHLPELDLIFSSDVQVEIHD